METRTDSKACQVRFPTCGEMGCVVSIHPSIPPSIPACLIPLQWFVTHHLAAWLLKWGLGKRGNNLGMGKSRDGTRVAVIAVNLRSAFYLITLLAVCLSLAGFLCCRMLFCRHSPQHPSSLQLPSSPSCLGHAEAPFPLSSQLLSCWSSRMTAMQKYA